MSEMGYIFGSISALELSMRHINKKLRNQARVNRKVAFFAVAVAAYAVVTEIHLQEQNRKIEQLSKELAALKTPEEEFEERKE